jgi:sporulation protein YlmC with PRC-barrel domain
MPADHPTLRARDLIGRRVRDRSGVHLGRIADLVADCEDRSTARIVEVIVTDGPWGRLLGYDSPDTTGPWLIEALSRWIIRRHMRTLPWTDIVLEPDPSEAARPP